MKSKSSNPRPEVAVASATQERTSACAGVDCAAVLRGLVLRYRKQQKPISVNFRRILPVLNSADRFTHLIHPYPAKLLVHIPFFFLANDLLSKPGDIILDPFCGSGTVLFEAQLAKRVAYGADANPLARLIARVKTTPLDLGAVKRDLRSILRRLPSEPSGPTPDVVNVQHWFYPAAVRQLQCLRESIEKTRSTAIRDFFLLCFSASVRRVSLADPRLSVPVRLKLGQYPKGHPLRAASDAHLRSLRHVNVAKVFEAIARSNITRFDKSQAHSAFEHPAELLCSDARNLGYEFSPNGNRGKSFADESVQMVITSPPYPGAQKYIRSSSLSLGWLRLCSTDALRAHKALIIGREELTKAESARVSPTGIIAADRVIKSIRRKNSTRANIAAAYLNDMRAAMREMSRVLKPGGHMILVAANNRIAGQVFRTVNYLRIMAEESGLSLTACLVDGIRSRGLMTKRNRTASVITREWVLVLTKGGVPEWNL